MRPQRATSLIIDHVFSEEMAHAGGRAQQVAPVLGAGHALQLTRLLFRWVVPTVPFDSLWEITVSGQRRCFARSR